MNIKISWSQCAVRIWSIYVTTFPQMLPWFRVLSINRKSCGGHLDTPNSWLFVIFCGFIFAVGWAIQLYRNQWSNEYPGLSPLSCLFNGWTSSVCRDSPGTGVIAIDNIMTAIYCFLGIPVVVVGVLVGVSDLEDFVMTPWMLVSCWWHVVLGIRGYH